MTRLTKPVTRESACLDRGVPLIVTLYPKHLRLRVKGTRKFYNVPYDACLWLAVKREADEQRREKLQARKAGRK